MHQRITTLLKIKDLKTTQIAAAVQTSESTIRNFKAGRSEPSVDFLKFLFTEFPTLNPHWLFFGKGEMLVEEKEVNYEERLESLEQKFQQIQPAIKSIKKKLDNFMDDFDGIDLDALTRLIEEM